MNYERENTKLFWTGAVQSGKLYRLLKLETLWLLPAKVVSSFWSCRGTEESCGMKWK